MRSGPGATNHFEAGAFCRSNDAVAYPNLMFHFLPLAIRYDGTQPEGGHGYQVHIGPMNSDARGSVKITTSDARVKPAIRFNYLSTDQDRREWVEAIRRRAHILGQDAFAPYTGGEASPGPEVETDEQILDWVRKDGETALHPVVHVPDGNRRDGGRRPGDDGRPRARRVAGGGRVGVSDDHERQPLRAGDDGGREGSRPDPRQHAAPGAGRPLLPARGCRSTPLPR